jgi:hypothetical protein
VQALAVSGALAEGVVRGIQVVNALQPCDIEGLTALFDTAVNKRLTQLVFRAGNLRRAGAEGD